MYGEREIDDLHAHFAEGRLKALPFGRTAPVIPLEEKVEPKFLPYLELVRHFFRISHVHLADMANDLKPLRKGNTWPAALTFSRISSETTPAIR
jgi:hypothetical protein